MMAAMIRPVREWGPVKNRRFRSEAAILASERRSREDEASRLSDEVPGLRTLSLVLDEYRGDSAVAGVRHTKHVVVAHAPALFELPCLEERCVGGGHDLTYDIMKGLRAKLEQFEGEDACAGRVGHDACGRTLRYVARAIYQHD